MDNKITISPTKNLQTVNLRKYRIDLSAVKNRRFMLNPETCTLILGDEKHGNGSKICSSHAEELALSGCGEPFDHFIRGWIGFTKSGEYKHGIIHFAPAITSEWIAGFERGCDALAIFASQDGISQKTIVRGFGNVCEQKMSNIYNN